MCRVDSISISCPTQSITLWPSLCCSLFPLEISEGEVSEHAMACPLLVHMHVGLAPPCGHSEKRVQNAVPAIFWIRSGDLTVASSVNKKRPHTGVQRLAEIHCLCEEGSTQLSCLLAKAIILG